MVEKSRHNTLALLREIGHLKNKIKSLFRNLETRGKMRRHIQEEDRKDRTKANMKKAQEEMEQS